MISQFLVSFINIFFEIWSLMIIVYVILSMFNPVWLFKINFITSLVFPLLRLVSMFIPKLGMIDFSPLVAVLMLSVVKYILMSICLAIPF